MRLLDTRDEHLVDHDGLVWCPRRHRDVDVEVCLGCGHLDALEVTDRPVAVRCRPPVHEDAPRPWFRPPFPV